MQLIELVPFLFGLLFLSLTAQCLIGPMQRRTLHRNGAIGIRTRHTQTSDEAWAAGHAAAVPATRRAALSGWALLAAAILAALMVTPIAGFAVAGAGYLLVLCWLFVATHHANRAARKITSR